MIKKLFFLFLLFGATSVFSQNYNLFLQGQASALYYNPSFSGSTGFHRLVLSTGFADWFFARPKLSNFNRLYLSYDQYFPKIKCGVGFSAGNIPWYYGSKDHLVNHLYNELNISPKIRLTKKLMLSVGFSGSMSTNSFIGHVDTVYFRQSKPLQFNYAIGALINAKRFYFGYSLRQYTSLLSKPDDYNINNTTYIDATVLLSTFQGAMMIRTNDKFSFSPTFIFQLYHHPDLKSSNDLMLMANFKFKSFFWAAGAGSSSMQFTLGYYAEKYRVAYSFGRAYRNPALLKVAQEITISYTFDDFKVSQ